MVTRREFLKVSGLAALAPCACARAPRRLAGVLVNDVHAQLNPTLVERVMAVDSLQTIQKLIKMSRREGKALCSAGGRHAMGGQQFATDAWLLDSRNLSGVLDFDIENGTLEIEAGIQWPEMMSYLEQAQDERTPQWGIIQKQTGADRLSLGGSAAANAHGRVLTRKPLIGDIEALALVDAAGRTLRCSRQENPELFRLAIGGYGLFGIIYSIKLRLARRQKIRRVVQVREVDNLEKAFEARIAEGFLYGDFQFSVDDQSDDFLRKGVFSCYQPVAPETPISPNQAKLSRQNWRSLLHDAHADKGTAFRAYAGHYLSTNGNIYWSDTQQLAFYEDGYHSALDIKLGDPRLATEMITEIYVPRNGLVSFLDEAREDFRRHEVNVIYGTIRVIERDDESFLAWARQSYACIIFNLHVVHSPAGIEHAARSFRRLIDMAIRRQGSYFLTYHRFARRDQVEACYPQFAEFLRLKQKYDPDERFQSDWYRHYRTMFADVL